VIDTQISVAWTATHHTFADNEFTRVWRAMASDPEWAAWIAQSRTGFLEPNITVLFEERDRARLVLRGNNLSYYIPIGHVVAAHQAGTLRRFGAEIFHDVWARWAQKRQLPPPPEVDDDVVAAVPGRLP
jgi:hypothetical protein